MRPLHYVILEPGAMPLNRTAKVDIVRLQELAADEVRKLRERGRWDGAGIAPAARYFRSPKCTASGTAGSSSN